MLIKNLVRIINSYKLSLFTIIFFELVYLIKGYSGNRFNFSNHDRKADNLPCPYYFLFKIKKCLNNRDFENFLDLGCGSGRVINFFNKNFFNKNIIGIEYFNQQYEYCKKIFKKEKNIKIIQADFTKSGFFQYNADCYFLNEPFKNNAESINLIEKIINYHLNKKKIIFIFVNGNEEVIKKLKNIKCIENFYINKTRGYSIYSLNEN